jgi:hypothetical protein
MPLSTIFQLYVATFVTFYFLNIKVEKDLLFCKSYFTEIIVSTLINQDIGF